jgi:predicted RecA/RadA family phage recombinase
MARNFIQPGEILTLTAPYARTAGQGAQVGSIFGVALSDVDNGAAGEFRTTGVFKLTKIESQAWTVGAKVYWDNTEKECTTVATVGMLIGVAAEAVADGAGDVIGAVRLNGTAPSTAEGPQAAIASFTFGTDITAATANNALTDSAADNPTKAQFDELAKEVGTKVNDILVALRAAGVIAS